MIASSHSAPPENTAAQLHTERANPTTSTSTAIFGAKSETTTATKQDRPSDEKDRDADTGVAASRAASYDPLFDDDHSVRGGGGGTTRGNSPSRLNSPNSAAMEISNTTDSTAPSGGLTFPGLNDNGNSVNGNGGFSSLSSLLAMGGGGDNRLAVASSIPTPVKLPPVNLPHIPSFREASPNNENLQPLKPPPPSTNSENTDVFLSLAVDGECLLWDRRVDKGNVRRLDIPKGCPPWSVSVSLLSY
jgi:hypothetical protein